MNRRAVHLRKKDIAHLLRAASAITQCSAFVMVGTGAVIAREKNLPLDLILTREIDLYPAEADDPERIATLIDGTIGEGSQFDVTFGYYAHGVACLPDDWRERAIDLTLPASGGTHCLCPEANDIALSKVCAWREKDRAWLRAAVSTSLIATETMTARVPLISHPIAPQPTELIRRLALLARN